MTGIIHFFWFELLRIVSGDSSANDRLRMARLLA